MTQDELAALRAAYPGAADVIQHHEEHPLNDTLFRIGREEGLDPCTAVAILIKTATSVAVGPLSLVGPFAIEQMEHPDFLRYVAAKLGAM